MTTDGTTIGGPAREFPQTRWSIIQRARDRSSPESRQALDELCRLYWKPIYAYIRKARAVGNEDAKDLAQEFLAELLEGDLLSRFAPERGSFRAYLRGAVRLFLLERHREADALKRGGDRSFITLDADQALLIESLAVAPGATAEEAFDRQWANSLIDHAVADLREELAGAGREVWWRVFDRHDLNLPPGGPPGYADLAQELGIRETDVHNYLTHCRRRMQSLVVERVRAYVASEEDVAAELASLFRR